MDFSPIQQRQVNDLWKRCRAYAKNLNRAPDGDGAEHIATSTSEAINVLAALNLPLFVAFQAVKRNAALDLRSTPKPRTLLYYFQSSPDTRPASIQTYHETLSRFCHRFALSDGTVSQNRWWTFLTASFLHQEPSHLLANLIGLLTARDRIASVPGMTASHAAVLTTLTSLVCGAVELLARPAHFAAPWCLMGFSHVLCAFLCVAALGSRGDRGWVERELALTLALAAGGMLRERRSGAPVLTGGHRVGHRAHIVGVACGAAYYFAFLRGAGGAETGAGGAAPGSSRRAAKPSTLHASACHVSGRQVSGHHVPDRHVSHLEDSHLDVSQSSEQPLELLDWEALSSWSGQKHAPA